MALYFRNGKAVNLLNVISQFLIDDSDVEKLGGL